MLLILFPEIHGNSWVDLNDDTRVLDSGNFLKSYYANGFCLQIIVLELKFLIVATDNIGILLCEKENIFIYTQDSYLIKLCSQKQCFYLKIYLHIVNHSLSTYLISMELTTSHFCNSVEDKIF